MPGIVDFSNGPSLGERMLNMTLSYVGAKEAMKRTELQRQGLELEKQQAAFARQMSLNQLSLQQQNLDLAQQNAWTAESQFDKQYALDKERLEIDKQANTPEMRKLAMNQLTAAVEEANVKLKIAQQNLAEQEKAYKELNLTRDHTSKPFAALHMRMSKALQAGGDLSQREADDLALGVMTVNTPAAANLLQESLRIAQRNRQEMRANNLSVFTSTASAYLSGNLELTEKGLIALADMGDSLGATEVAKLIRNKDFTAEKPKKSLMPLQLAGEFLSKNPEYAQRYPLALAVVSGLINPPTPAEILGDPSAADRWTETLNQLAEIFQVMTPNKTSATQPSAGPDPSKWEFKPAPRGHE